LAKAELLEGDGALDFGDIGGEVSFEGGEIDGLTDWASHDIPDDVSVAELSSSRSI